MNFDSYRIFYIPKGKGYRKIVTYKDLKQRAYHNAVNRLIYRRILPSKFAKAYSKNRSIVVNARTHMFNDTFICMDIEDFFPSINHKILIRQLFCALNQSRVKKVSKEDCIEIVKSCAISEKGLAVGLIPSPALANLYLKNFDNILYGKLKKMSLDHVLYTRYADDIVISFRGFEDHFCDVKKLVEQTLVPFRLKLNNYKTRKVSFETSNHVRITGISICRREDNFRFLSAGRKRKNELYQMAIKCFENAANISSYEKQRVKGLESFVLSVEGKSYESTYSEGMLVKLKQLGFDSLHDLVRAL